MLEAVMNAHAVSYPSLQRRLIADRRSRALFLPRTTQHLRRHSVFVELARVATALAAATAWALLLLLAAA
ncbi:MAG TPA: hypothetical protein VGM22_05235 [Methylomirabilota bacterium]